MDLFHLEHRAVRHKLAMPRSFAGLHNKYAPDSIPLCDVFSPLEAEGQFA
jgi:hypothetical protein